ncbi:MAG: hypothetical protein BWK79_03295, partial [Beggiatoa sp. IS2]
MELLQEKLDVIQKKRSNLFNWRGQFTPEFVEYLLGYFAKAGDLVIDPFSGSGTVLQESAKMNTCAEGFEINPSAYAMSKFFTFSNLSMEQRFELFNTFELKLNDCLRFIDNEEKIYQNYSDYRQAYSNLINFGKLFQFQLDKLEKILLLNILFLSERDKNLTVKQSLGKSLYYIKNALLALPSTNAKIRANLLDAREIHQQIREQADLILTSPPYINVFNYHQNYRGLVEIFNFDVLKIANSEFGSNRKNRGNRFKTVVQYCLDMEEAIRSFWGVLKPNATLIMVLGRQSNVRNTAFYNGKIVMDILEQVGGFEQANLLERKFTNKFGNNIKEDILIYKKISQL